MTPDVSVIIAAYRAGATLERAVGSALGQEGVAVEVIVVDDASSDGTADLARRLTKDARVRVLGMVRNGGPAAARNRALDVARGRWVAVLDADDAMLPDRLARLCALASARRADMVLGNLATAEGGRPFVPLPPAPRRIGLRDWIAANRAAANAPTPGYLKPLMSRDFLMAHGLRYDETLRNGEDFHLVLAVLAAGGKVWLSPRADYVYARHAGSVSHRADPAQMAALAAADCRFAAQHDDPAIARMLRRRAGAILRLASAERAIAALRRGRIGAATGVMLRHPAALPRMVRQLGCGLRRRLQP